MDEYVVEFKCFLVLIVFVVFVEEQEEILLVVIDYEQVIYDVVKLLVDKGYIDIVFVFGLMIELINCLKKL